MLYTKKTKILTNHSYLTIRPLLSYSTIITAIGVATRLDDLTVPL